jgi:hypothetical protein
MDKKFKAIVGAIAIGALMLCATAYAAIGSPSGYDIYKAAVKNTLTVKSMALATEVSVEDNGIVLIDAKSDTKINKAEQSMSNIMTVTTGNQSKTNEIYNFGGKTIMKNSDSDIYNVRESSPRPGHQETAWQAADASRIQEVENVADALATYVQNYVNISPLDGDGSQVVLFQMLDSQVPPVVNAAASLAIRNMGREKANWGGEQENQKAFGLEANLQDKIPELVANIKVSNIEVKAVINSDNMIQEQTESFTIAGTDAAGKAHELSVSVTTVFSGYNNTVPDKVDLTGKQVKAMSNERMGMKGKDLE